MKTSNKNFNELKLEEISEIRGGVWFIVVLEVAAAFGLGYSIGHGFGSHGCNCPNFDGRRFDEIGPTQNMS
jgi:lactobin A/cerein 7B family class IIb bacteriocin